MATRARPKLKPFTVDHFCDWALQHELDNGEPWEVEDYFALFLEDVFAGFPIPWLVVPEENAKTTNVAGLSLYVAEFKPSAYVPVAASARDQAEWIYRQAEGFVKRSRREDTFACLEGYRRIRCDGMGSRIQVFAADDRSGDGIIPGGIAVLDELHRHKSLALYRTWAGKLRKRAAQLIVISTAGEVGGEFERERARLRQEATLTSRKGRCFVRAEHWLGERRLAVLHDYAVPEGGDVEDLELVKEANPFSGVTIESLREKRAMTGSVQHWSRFTCNLATRSEEAAISEIDWDGARVAETIPVGVPVWVGLDLGWKVDPTAIQPLWWRDAEFRLLGPAVIITPPRNGTHTSPRVIEEALYELHQRNPVECVVMDMTNGEQTAAWVEAELGATVIEYSQKIPSQVIAYAKFMEALREGWLKHTGDVGLTRHVLNANARVLPGGDIVFARPKESRTTSQMEQERREIDALVAAAMVHSAAALQTEPAVPLVSWA
jgi:phage terminase large subunit-like protein